MAYDGGKHPVAGPRTLAVWAGLLCACLVCACAGGAARQTADERQVLQTPLIKGERIIRANSCGRLSRPSILAGVSSDFGSCFLTNLRLIYEDSKWFRALKTASKFIPTGGDFGLTTAISGAAKAFNVHYVVRMGKQGKLSVVKRKGRLLIPLSTIKKIELKEAFCLTGMCPRWVVIHTGEEKPLVFEMYIYPPDRSGTLPAKAIISSQWKTEIERAKRRTFGLR